MDDLLAQEKVLRNTNRIRRISQFTWPINWTLSLLMMKFMIQYANQALSAAPQTARQFEFFIILMFIGGTLRFIFTEIQIRKMLNAIKVQGSGITILGPFGQEQIVNWNEISVIEKKTIIQKTLLQKESINYTIRTIIPAKFSLFKKKEFFFYVTDNHEKHKELLALLKEKTGLKIEDPARKPIIPPWQPGNAR